MPELPEVETIKRGLDKTVSGKKIKVLRVETSFEKKVLPATDEFCQKLKNKTIKNVMRRSKLLIFELSDGLKLIVHLKMTGQLVYRPDKLTIVAGGHPIPQVETLPNKFTRVEIQFTDKTILFFNDVRKFGFMKLVDSSGLREELNKYGHEPLDKAFTLKHFNDLMEKSARKKIKSFLLEQKLIAGLGNIYADESLFAAKIKPFRLVATLKVAERELLFKSIKKIIRKAIKYRGTTFHDYVNASGQKGNFQQHLRVYGRSKLKCLRCRKGIIQKIKLGSRSASFCPVCQK